MANYVPARGPEDARIIIVGEAPGAQEDKQKKPFVGYSGQLLQASLLAAGIPPNGVFITNTVKYRPKGNKIAEHIKITKKSISLSLTAIEGLIELYGEIASTDANVIVPVGNTALWALTGKKGIGKYRGSMLELSPPLVLLRQIPAAKMEGLLPILTQITGKKVIPTYHPAAVQRQWNLKPILDFDLKRISREQFTSEIKLPEREFVIDPTAEEFAALVPRLLRAERLAFDIECVGGKLFSIAFSDRADWAVSVRAESLEKRKLIAAVCDAPMPKIAQNGVFDCSYLRKKNGIEVRNYADDTMFAQRCIYPEMRVGLDFLTSMYTREPYYKDEGKNWDPRDAEDMERFLTYGAKDAAITFEVMEEMYKDELKDEDILRTYRHTMDQTPVIVDMMAGGLRIDTDRLKEIKNETEAALKTLQNGLDKASIELAMKAFESAKGKKRQRIFELIKDIDQGYDTEQGGLNVNSRKALLRFMRDALGIDTNTTAEDELKELYGKTGNPFLLTIVDVRKKRKFLSSYARMRVSNDGRTYFAVNPVGTKTGRWSMRKDIDGYGINMQTVPGALKDAFIPEDGHVLGYFDLAQAEDRVVAYYASIEEKISVFTSGGDVHSLTAAKIFDVSIEEVQEEDARYHREKGKPGPMRYIGKRCNLAFNYGMGPYKFARLVNKDAHNTGVRLSNSQGKAFRDRHLAAYPQLPNYWDWVEGKLYNGRTLKNPFGRKRVFAGRLDQTTFRDAYSYLPQSTIPDIINRGAIEIHGALPEVSILVQVHDALLIQIPEDGAEEIAGEIERLMQVPFSINEKEITIPVDYKLGRSWKECD